MSKKSGPSAAGEPRLPASLGEQFALAEGAAERMAIARRILRLFHWADRERFLELDRAIAACQRSQALEVEPDVPMFLTNAG